MLQIYDRWYHKKVDGLTEYKDLKIERTLDGLESLSFFSPSQVSQRMNVEVYIRTKDNEYIIKEIERNSDYFNVVCVLNLEELKGKEIERIDVTNSRLEDSINLAIAGTGYRAIIYTNKDKRRTTRKALCSSLDVLQDIAKVFRVEYKFDTINKVLHVYEKRGSNKGVYFHSDLNLNKVTTNLHSHDFITRLIPIGNEGMRIGSINKGTDYVHNNQFSPKIITAYWEDNRYTDAESLKEDAIAKLEELSKPFISYNADVIDLANASEDSRYKVLDYQLGDVVTLIDKEQKIKEVQRIVKIIEYPDEPFKNTCELANKIPLFEEIQQEIIESAEIVDSVTNTDGTIDGDKIDGIKIEKIENFEAEIIKVTKLVAFKAEVENLIAQKADIVDLNATKATIGTLIATKAEITELNVVKATIEQLKADSIQVTDLEAINAKITVLEADSATILDLNALKTYTGELIAGKANITDLNASNAQIDILKSKTATIDNLLAGNLTADNIKAGSITAGSGIIADGAIGNAQISSLDVTKLNAGILDTSRITVQGSNGRLKIHNNLLQVFSGVSGEFERVALGDLNKDGTEFGLRIRGADGQTILVDQNGLTNKGFTDGYEKLADNQLDPNKIDINKVVNRINQDGTISIDSTKVVVGNKSLDIELSEQRVLETQNRTEIGKHGTSIIANTEKIALKLDSQDFTQYKSINDGNISTINTNLTKATTAITAIQGEISLKASKTEVAIVENKIDNLEIGGRNLLLNSEGKTVNSYPQTYNINGVKTIVEDNTLPSNYYMRISDFEITGISPSFYLSPFSSHYFSENLSEQSVLISLYLRGDATFRFQGIEKEANKWHKVELTIKFSKNNYHLYIVSDGLVNLDISSIKVEKGNKATGWSPAPEDVSKEILDAKTYADTKKGEAISESTTIINSKVAEIKLTTDSIKLDVSNNVSNISKKTDKTYVDGKIATINTDLSSVVNKSALLETNLSGITGRLESTETNILNVDKKFEDLQVGGDNLIVGLHTKYNPSDFYETDFNRIKEVQINGENWVEKINGEPLRLRKIDIKPDTEYTYSVDIHAVADTPVKLSCFFNGGYAQKIITVTKTPERYQFTFKSKADASYDILHLYTDAGVRFADFQLQEGNKGTSWNISPEELKEKTISQSTEIINTKVAEIKVTTDGITQNVSNVSSKVTTNTNNITGVTNDVSSVKSRTASLETNIAGITSRVTSTENNVSSINGNITSLTSRINTAEQKITPTAIESVVSSKFATKTDVDGVKGRVTSAESTITQQAGLISQKVNVNGVISSINQSPETIQLSASRINLRGAVTVLDAITNNLGTINAGRLLGTNIDMNLNTGYLNMVGGAFKLTNSYGEVVIDGQSNIFKIAKFIDLDITPGTELDHTRRWNHGLGYTPAFLAFQVDTPSEITGNTHLPAFGLGTYTDGTINISSVIRMTVDYNQIKLTYKRSTSNVQRNVRVRVYLFQEKLL